MNRWNTEQKPLFRLSLKVDISAQWLLLAFLSSEIGSEKRCLGLQIKRLVISAKFHFMPALLNSVWQRSFLPGIVLCLCEDRYQCSNPVLGQMVLFPPVIPVTRTCTIRPLPTHHVFCRLTQFVTFLEGQKMQSYLFHDLVLNQIFEKLRSPTSPKNHVQYNQKVVS